MKSLLILLALCGSVLGETEPVTLAWDDDNTAPDIAGYRIYITQVHGVWGSAIQSTTKEKTVDLPINTLHYAIVTAVNTSGLESLPSSELVFQVYRPGEGKVPSPPKNLRKISGVTIGIESSSDLKVWATLYELLVPEENAGSKFYRLALISVDKPAK